MKMENRIVLDYVMMLVLLVLMVKLMTGVIVHEILGMGFVLLTVAHLLNNKNWFANMTKEKGQLALNVLLLMSFLSVTISGVMLSVALFSFMNIPYREIYYAVHTLSAYALTILSLAHMALHIKTIRMFFRNKKQSSRKAGGTQT